MICNKLGLCIEEELDGRHLDECDNSRKNCIESSDKRLFVKCEEKRKKYRLENTLKNQVISYKVDGGIIAADKYVPAGTNKCDYMYVVNADERAAVLIELKGADVSKALRQIKDTLALFKDLFKNFAHVYGRVIVTSSTPDLKASPEYVNLMRVVRQGYHGNSGKRT